MNISFTSQPNYYSQLDALVRASHEMYHVGTNTGKIT